MYLLAKRGDVRPVVVTESAGLENSLRDLTNGCVSRILIGRKRTELQIKRAKHRTESSEATHKIVLDLCDNSYDLKQHMEKKFELLLENVFELRFQYSFIDVLG